MKSILKLFTALAMCLMVGFGASAVYGINPLAATGGAFGVSTVLSFLPKSEGSFQMALLKEAWETELINKFRHTGDWMSRIANKNNMVNNNAINLAEIGGDPAVLINNSTYPIASNGRTDAPLSIALDKFETENTIITDDELYALPYDKPGSVMRQHREVLEEQTAEKGLHSLAPAANTADTPILETTGADDGAGAGRKRLTSADVIKMKRKFDDLKVPKKDRILVLCNEHIEDLLLEDKNSGFSQAYHGRDTGLIAKKFYGFDVYESSYNPIYASDNTKKAFGAAEVATDRNASVAFYAGNCVKATGEVKMYYSSAETDPKNRESVVGFRLYNIVIPKTSKWIGAIVSYENLA